MDKSKMCESNSGILTCEPSCPLRPKPAEQEPSVPKRKWQGRPRSRCYTNPTLWLLLFLMLAQPQITRCSKNDPKSTRKRSST